MLPIGRCAQRFDTKSIRTIRGLTACLRPMADQGAPTQHARCANLRACATPPASPYTSPPRHKRAQQPTHPSPPRHKRHKPRPTHFLALQLSQHAAAVDAAAQVQAAVTAAAPHLQPSCVECSTLHVTLQVMAIADDGGLVPAVASLGRALACDGLLAPAVLWLDGLVSFNDSVLFFKVASEPPDHLGALARAARSVFAGFGCAQDRRPFTPHATVMKTSRMPRGGAVIAPALYEGCTGVRVGPLRVDSLKLCSMARCEGDDYYPVVASLCLEVGEVIVGDAAAR